MMEPVIIGSVGNTAENAVQELEERLEAAVRACEIDIEKALTNLGRLKTALESLRRDVPAPRDGRISRARTPSRKRMVARGGAGLPRDLQGSAASVIRSFVRAELRKAGHPLNRSEILDRLSREGVDIDAVAPIKRIAKVMWSSPEFVNEGAGYWFAGEPMPARPKGS